jgi:hypothetical protein
VANANAGIGPEYWNCRAHEQDGAFREPRGHPDIEHHEPGPAPGEPG